MENKENNAKKSADENSLSRTPHELIKQHSRHPDEPVTEADLQNLDLDNNPETTPAQEASDSDNSIALSDEEKAKADALADQLKKDNTGMSYEADL